MEHTLSAPDAQVSFNRIVDDRAGSNEPPPFPPCLNVRIDGSVCPSIPIQDALPARNIGLKQRDAMRAKFMAQARKPKIATRKPKITAHKPKIVTRKPAASARARRSIVAHGGARKAADDGSGDGPPQPKTDRQTRRRGSKAAQPQPPLTLGWVKSGNFPSTIGRLINPGRKAYSSFPGLAVAVIEPRHDGRTGETHTVSTVAGRGGTTIHAHRDGGNWVTT
jgi:hypothetical protein